MCIGKRADDRKCCAGAYRYGFNGKEKDTEKEFGSNTTYDYGFRIYNPAIAKFLSVDPLTKKFPFYTPYQFAGNKPIRNIDLDGAEELPNELFNYAMTVGKNFIRKETEKAVGRIVNSIVDSGEEQLEEKLDEMSNSSDPLTASIGMTGEFVFGLGPETRRFGPDDPFTQSLRESNLTTQALEAYMVGYNEFVNGDRPKPPGEYRVDFSPSPLFWHGNTGPVEEFLTDLEFTTAQFTGTALFNFSLSEDGNTLNIEVYDTKTEYSFMYHMEGTDRHGRDEDSIMGETTQYYNFSIPLDKVKERGE